MSKNPPVETCNQPTRCLSVHLSRGWISYFSSSSSLRSPCNFRISVTSWVTSSVPQNFSFASRTAKYRIWINWLSGSFRLRLDPKFSRVSCSGTEIFQYFKYDLNTIGMMAVHHISPDDIGCTLKYPVLSAGIKSHVVAFIHKGHINRKMRKYQGDLLQVSAHPPGAVFVFLFAHHYRCLNFEILTYTSSNSDQDTIRRISP